MANPKRWPIGLQSSATGRPDGIGEVIKELTRHNIAFFSASTDAFSILTDLQNARRSDPHVPHTANFTLTGYWPKEDDKPNRYHFNVPEYTKPASEAVAQRHWDMVEKREAFNDPARSPIDWSVPCIWISTWNEIRDYVGWFKRGDEKEEVQDFVEGYEGNADLVGMHAYEIGKEAVRRGYRWAAFGFSGGSPEEGFWEAPGVLKYLRLCEQHPDQLGVALHEYSLADTIINRPDHIGRFKLLHAACDKHGIRRPVIQFKEFGWRDIHIPHNRDVAMRELIEVAAMYAEHPNIHGAALWTVHPWQGSDIHVRVAGLIPHLRDAALMHAREIPPLKVPFKQPAVVATEPDRPKEQPLTPVPSPLPDTTSSTTQTGYVTAEAGLHLRREPSTAAEIESIIDTLSYTSHVEIITRVGNWYHVRAGGQTGYVYADYVALVPPAHVPPPVASSGTMVKGFHPGMNVNPGVHQPDVDRLRGLSWVRYVFIAADQGRSIDEAFQASYGPLARTYADAGIKSLIILNHETVHGNRPWTNGNWDGYAEEYGRAARRVAELFAPMGDQVAYQIGNEQDSGWGDDAGNKNPSAHGLPPESYALLLHAAARNIREVAPHATIVSGGLKTGPHNGVNYLKATQHRLGGRLPVDAIAYHPYGRFVNTDPFYGQKHGRLPDALALFRNNFPEYPLWITEIGIPGEANPIGPEHYGSIALYMNEFIGEVANRHAEHVPVVIWFAWTDGMNNAGILTADGREKSQIYQAFQAMKVRGVQAKAKGLDNLEKSLESLMESGPAEWGVVFGAVPYLNLRSEPRTEGGMGTVIGKLVDGTEVLILEKLAGWYRVRAGEQEGFVSADFVALSPAGVKPELPKPAPRRKAPVLGVHGAPGGAAPPAHLWDHWTHLLTEMGIHWYKQCETTDDTGPGSIFQWARHLKQKGFEPIIRYLQQEQFPNNLEDKFFRQMERYANEGIHWAEIGNEPNLDSEWKSDWKAKYEGEKDRRRRVADPRMRWGNGESIETLARVWVQDASRAANAGAWPAFYAMGPTDWRDGRPEGFYSSTMFTNLVVARLASHHRAETIRLFRDRQAWIAVHVAKYDMDYDYDPYRENPHKPWDMALRGYEVVANAFRRHFAGDLDVNQIPIISTEGGVFTPEHRNKLPDPGRVPANDEEHARQIVEMFRYVENNTTLTAMCPWCIAEGHNIIGHGTDEFRHHGWFKEENGRLVERPVYHALRRLRQEGGKDVSLEEMASEGLESEGEPLPPAAPSAPVTLTITVEIKISGNLDPNDIVVRVNPAK